jgi:hypothetical protein
MLPSAPTADHSLQTASRVYISTLCHQPVRLNTNFEDEQITLLIHTVKSNFTKRRDIVDSNDGFPFRIGQTPCFKKFVSMNHEARQSEEVHTCRYSA